MTTQSPEHTIHSRKRVPKVRRVRVYTRLSYPIRKRLAAYCAATGRSERAVIEQGVVQVLDGNQHNPSATTPIDRLVEAIDNDQRRRDRQHRELQALVEAFGRFLRIWFATHQPPQGEAGKRALSESELLCRQFARSVAAQFADGHLFIHDLLSVENVPSHAR